MSKFEVYTDNSGETRFRYRAGNGEVVFSSAGYKAKAAALKAIKSIKRGVASADFVEVTGNGKSGVSKHATGEIIQIDAVADEFGMSKSQLASTAGLATETLQKAARSRAPKTQARIREMLEIVDRISGWAGGPQQAMAWYRAQPIPAFGERTAEALVKEGRAAEVRDYLDHVALGGFA